MATSNKRIEKSYKVYQKYRQEAHEKGFGLKRELTLEEYTKAHKGLSHAHFKHIARTVAQSEKTSTVKESATIARRIKEAQLYDNVDPEKYAVISEKYSSGKKIRALEYSIEETERIIAERTKYYTDREVKIETPIQPSPLGILFNELIDAGLSFREADRILYGDKKK